jgi:hypothetical protein
MGLDSLLCFSYKENTPKKGALLKFKTTQTSDRLPPVTLSVNSIIRIHEGLKSGQKQATQGVSADVSAKYENLLSKGEIVVKDISGLPNSTQEVLPIDRAIDRIVSGIDDVTRGLRKIYDADAAIPLLKEEEVVAEEAITFAQVSLPNGTTFLKGAWRAEWAEIVQMLSRLSAEGVSLRIGSFDFSPLVERLTRANEVYGKALKISYNEAHEPSILSSINEWGEALDELDTSVAYHHKKDAALRAQVFSSFFAELKYLEEVTAKDKARQDKIDQEKLAQEAKTITDPPGKD